MIEFAKRYDLKDLIHKATTIYELSQLNDYEILIYYENHPNKVKKN